MCTKKCKGFNEVYLDANAEMMVDICITCGQIVDLYTYASDADGVEYYKESIDDYVKIADKWQSQGNNLFVHCPKNKIAWSIKKILDETGDASFTLDGEAEEEQYQIIKRMLDRYKIEFTVPFN